MGANPAIAFYQPVMIYYIQFIFRRIDMSLLLLFWNNISTIFAAACISNTFSLDLGTFLIMFFLLYILINTTGIAWQQITCKILLPIVALGLAVWKCAFPSAAIVLGILSVVFMLLQLFIALYFGKKDKAAEKAKAE